MTGNKEIDLQVTRELADKVVKLVKTEIDGGADAASLASALLGVGADLLQQTNGRLSAAKTIHGVALDVLHMEDDGNTRH